MKKIAIPLVADKFSEHFGGADSFAFFEVDEEKKTIIASEKAAPPPHERGVFPVWLNQQGVNVVFAGGMGPRAHDILARYGIEVLMGVRGSNPEDLVQAWLDRKLETGIFFSAPMLMLGAGLGLWFAWKWMHRRL